MVTQILLEPLWGSVSLAPPNMTGDDLLRLPDDGNSNELFEGMVISTMTSPGHGDVCQRLGFKMGLWALTTNFPNRILQNALYDLTKAGAKRRTVLAPDISITRYQHRPVWNVPQDIPLLAVEIISESQTLAQLTTKAKRFIQAGVDEVWAIDHEARIVEVWTAQGKTTLHDTQALTSPLLPGFSLAIADLLDG